MAKRALFRYNEDCRFVQLKYGANKFKSNLHYIGTWFMRQSIETTAPGIRHLPGNVTFLQCYISTFPPAPRGKLDCYTPMAPVCTLKILLNRFHGNYSLGIAQKIVPSVAKNACMQRGISKIMRNICDDICFNNKIYTEIVRPQNVRQ